MGRCTKRFSRFLKPDETKMEVRRKNRSPNRDCWLTDCPHKILSLIFLSPRQFSELSSLCAPYKPNTKGTKIRESLGVVQ